MKRRANTIKPLPTDRGHPAEPKISKGVSRRALAYKQKGDTAKAEADLAQAKKPRIQDRITHGGQREFETRYQFRNESGIVISGLNDRKVP